MKKGLFVLDLLVIILFVVGFAVSTLIAFKVHNEFKAQALPQLNTEFDDNVTLSVMERTDDVLQSMDYIFLIVLVGLAVTVVISVAFIQSHPVFFIVCVVLLIVVILLAAQFSNLFYEIRTTPDLQNATSSYSIIPSFMDRLPLIALIIGAIILIYLFGKGKGWFGG